MSITGIVLRGKAKQLAQNGTTGGTGVQLLLTDPDDYNEAIADALRVFDGDKPNRRVVDVTVGTAGFRFVVSGTGTVLPTSGLNAWVDGGSYITDVWFPYDANDQAAEPIDQNLWRQVQIPGDKEVLELLGDRAAVGQVLRLEYTVPHVLSETDAAATSVRAADQRAIITLSASMLLLVAAVKAVQNTGNTGLPNDIVDRRSQSDIYKSRAKDLRDVYASLVGTGGGDSLSGASATKDLDTAMSFRSAPLWHPNSSH